MFRFLSLNGGRAILLCAIAAPTAFADNGEAAPIPWAYSAYFGMGRYSITNEESVYVLGGRLGRRLRAASYDDEDKRRTVGVEFRVGISAGVYRFERDTLDTLGFDDVGTVSAVPGLEFDIPVTSRWSLKPVIYAGWGTAIRGNDSAWIYWAGLKSRLRFHNSAFDWALVDSLSYVGYSSTSGRHSNVLPLLTGVEFERSLRDKKIGGNTVQLHWHIAYTTYLNPIELEPVSASFDTVKVEDEWEIGAAFSTGRRPLRLWRFHWDRVGVAYRFSSSGAFEGVSLVFRSLFDR